MPCTKSPKRFLCETCHGESNSLATSFPGSLFSTSLVVEKREPGCGWSRGTPWQTFFHWGRVFVIFWSRNSFSLDKHFWNKLSSPYNVSFKKVNVLFPQEIPKKAVKLKQELLRPIRPSMSSGDYKRSHTQKRFVSSSELLLQYIHYHKTIHHTLRNNITTKTLKYK